MMPVSWLALYKHQTSHIVSVPGEKIEVGLELFCDKMLYMSEARQHDAQWKLLKHVKIEWQ